MARKNTLGRLRGRAFLAWLKRRRRWFETGPGSPQGFFVTEDAALVFDAEDGTTIFETEGAF